MSSALDLLELRLRYIEDRIVGKRVPTPSDDSLRTPSDDNSICEQLIQIEAKLKELTAGKERFNNCFQKCQELDKYLDTEYIDRIMATDSTKFEQIINFEEQIRTEAKSLERVEELSKNIDSIHLRSFEKLVPKLNKIRLITLEESQESAKIEDKSRQLILTYNQWLQNMKSQLSVWDQKLTQLENQKKSKKSNQIEID